MSDNQCHWLVMRRWELVARNCYNRATDALPSGTKVCKLHHRVFWREEKRAAAAEFERHYSGGVAEDAGA